MFSNEYGEAAVEVLDILDKIRSKYLQSVDENKGHTR